LVSEPGERGGWYEAWFSAPSSAAGCLHMGRASMAILLPGLPVIVVVMVMVSLPVVPVILRVAAGCDLQRLL